MIPITVLCVLRTETIPLYANVLMDLKNYQMELVNHVNSLTFLMKLQKDAYHVLIIVINAPNKVV